MAKSKPKKGTTSKKNKPALWKKIVARIKAGSKGGKPGQWSARKAQLAVAAYKKAGGGYIGKKSKKNSLSKWTKQKWRTPSGKKSSETGEVYAPSKTISKLKSTSKGRKKLASANRKKKAATKAGKQHARHGLHKGKKR
jgi:hypothetical protein